MDLSNITINTQSSIRIAGEKTVYFDAFQIQEESHDADIIFVTHDHPDHFEPDSIAKIMKADTILVAPASMEKKVVKASGIAKENLVFVTPGETTNVLGLQVEAVAAYNCVKPFHMKSNKWVGYVVTLGGVRYYVAGDTDPNADNRMVSCDVAIVPIGGHFTMGWKTAAEFVLELSPVAAVPTHYGGMVGKPTDGEDFKKLIESNTDKIQVEVKL